MGATELCCTPDAMTGGEYMVTSCDGNAFRITGPLWGESTGYRWIPLTKEPVMWSFYVYFEVSPDELLNKQLMCR